MWFKDAIVYHILVDRFAGYNPLMKWNKPTFLGGNLQGVADKLPYLDDLGINTIWLSPICKTTSYHGYHITDFYSTDERYGTEEDLRDLIHMAHRRNIRIILDLVPNHCSSRHPFFQKALRDKKSQYRPWFYFRPFGNEYLCFLDYAELPKFNLDYPAARQYIIGAAKHWLSLGIDGFRLDHAVGPSHRFWKSFRQEVRSVEPEAVLIGEAWLEGIHFTMLKSIRIRHKYIRWLFRLDPWKIQREYIGEFDGSLDFLFRHSITRHIAWKDHPETGEKYVRIALAQQYHHLPPDYFLPSFIENHDMNRFLYDAGQDKNKLKMALKLQFSLPQPPILYYGTETGLSHEKPVSWDVPFSDLQARKPMPWESLDLEMIDYCKELIRKRKVTSY
jgi:glycosidase